MTERRSEVLKVRCTPTERDGLDRARGTKTLSAHVRAILFPTSPRRGGSSPSDGPRPGASPRTRGAAGSLPAPQGKTTSQGAGPPPSGSPATPSEAVRAPETVSGAVDDEQAYILRRAPELEADGDSPAVARAIARQEFKRGKR